MPSDHVDASVLVDRRTRKRAERRDHLLALAARLVDDHGLAGLTMAALAEEADYATASLYTYFASHGALVGALQERALEVLGQTGEENLARWDDALGQPASARARKVAALARLWAFADVFLTAPQHHQHEFRLQQQLLASPAGDAGSAGTVVIAAAMRVLDLPRRLLAEAVDVKALDAPADLRNPADDPVDGAMARTLIWVAAMNGLLLLDGLGEVVPLPGLSLGRDLTGSVLRGWGADPTLVSEARTAANDWTDR